MFIWIYIASIIALAIWLLKTDPLPLPARKSENGPLMGFSENG
jgi:hypothetical protein